VFLVDRVEQPKTCGLRHPKTQKYSPAEQGLRDQVSPPIQGTSDVTIGNQSRRTLPFTFVYF
jgi:hypothetical protein